MIKLRTGDVEVIVETAEEAAELVRLLRQNGTVRPKIVREIPITARCVDCDAQLDSNKKHRCDRCRRERKKQQDKDSRENRFVHTARCKNPDCQVPLEDARFNLCDKCRRPKLEVV